MFRNDSGNDEVRLIIPVPLSSPVSTMVTLCWRRINIKLERCVQVFAACTPDGYELHELDCIRHLLSHGDHVRFTCAEYKSDVIPLGKGTSLSPSLPIYYAYPTVIGSSTLSFHPVDAHDMVIPDILCIFNHPLNCDAIGFRMSAAAPVLKGSGSASSNGAPVVVDMDPSFIRTVDRILDLRYENGVRYYQVKWLSNHDGGGYDGEGEVSWEPAYCVHAPDILKAFHRKDMEGVQPTY